MDFTALGTFWGIVALGLIALGFFVIKKKKTAKWFKGVGIALGVIVILGLIALPSVDFGTFTIGEGEKDTEFLPQNFGDSATLTLDAYYGDHGGYNSKTETYPAWVIYDKDLDVYVLSGTGGNSLSTYVGADLWITCDSNSTQFCEEKEFTVSTEAQTVEVNAYETTDTGTSALSMYDSTMTALTSASANNNTDYNYSVSSDAQKTLIMRVENTDANKVWDIGAICTYASNTTVIDDYEVIESGWSKVGLNKELRDTDPSVTFGGGTCSGDFLQCYVPSGGVKRLLENQYIDVDMRLDTASTDPVQGSASCFGAVVLDRGYALGKDGEWYNDFYAHDDNERHSEVGIVEAENTPYGLTPLTGVSVQAL
jgi:hypothetical protein